MNIYLVPRGWVSRSWMTSFFFFFRGWVEKGTSPRGHSWTTLIHIYHILIISQAFSWKCQMKMRPSHKYKSFSPVVLMQSSWKRPSATRDCLYGTRWIIIQALLSLRWRHFVLTPSLVLIVWKGLICSASRVQLEIHHGRARRVSGHAFKMAFYWIGL